MAGSKPAAFSELPSITAKSRAEWRSWLEKNHRKSAGVWLIFFKVRSGKPSVSYPHAVEEALCFGWIDSKVQPVDAESYRQVFVPRKAKSVWSKVNKDRIETLIARGLMREAGFAAIEIAKANGYWTSLDAVEALELPEDFAAALAANPAAAHHFEAFPRSVKKTILYRLNGVKREATRRKKIEEVIDLTARGLRLETMSVKKKPA